MNALAPFRSFNRIPTTKAQRKRSVEAVIEPLLLAHSEMANSLGWFRLGDGDEEARNEFAREMEDNLALLDGELTELLADCRRVHSYDTLNLFQRAAEMLERCHFYAEANFEPAELGILLRESSKRYLIAAEQINRDLEQENLSPYNISDLDHRHTPPMLSRA